MTKEHKTEYMRKYRAANPGVDGTYRAKNREKLRDKSRVYHAANRGKTKAYYEANKEKLRECGKAWREANQEKIRENRLMRFYKMTLDEYNSMDQSQGGVCAICGKPNRNGGRLAVDHDHTTGVVRGLLCSHCNAGLGQFLDNEDVLASAISYLRERAS